jgi:hypothetical protein
MFQLSFGMHPLVDEMHSLISDSSDLHSLCVFDVLSLHLLTFLVRCVLSLHLLITHSLDISARQQLTHHHHVRAGG